MHAYTYVLHDQDTFEEIIYIYNSLYTGCFQDSVIAQDTVYHFEENITDNYYKYYDGRKQIGYRNI